MSGQDCVSHAKMLLTPCYHIGLFPLNELNRGKPVSLIVVNIPYLLALTPCITCITPTKRSDAQPLVERENNSSVFRLRF